MLDGGASIVTLLIGVHAQKLKCLRLLVGILADQGMQDRVHSPTIAFPSCSIKGKQPMLLVRAVIFRLPPVPVTLPSVVRR